MVILCNLTYSLSNLIHITVRSVQIISYTKQQRRKRIRHTCFFQRLFYLSNFAAPEILCSGYPLLPTTSQCSSFVAEKSCIFFIRTTTILLMLYSSLTRWTVALNMVWRAVDMAVIDQWSGMMFITCWGSIWPARLFNRSIAGPVNSSFCSELKVEKLPSF